MPKNFLTVVSHDFINKLVALAPFRHKLKLHNSVLFARVEYILEVTEFLSHMYIVLVIGVDEYYLCKLTLLLIKKKIPFQCLVKLNNIPSRC